MRFSAFIVANQQVILEEWVRQARTLLRAAEYMSIAELEDHGRQLILAIAADMDAPQSERQRFAKSQYVAGEPNAPLTAGGKHGRSRQRAGFDSMQMHGEFRALRASILRLWARSSPTETAEVAAEEIARFNEAVDQALAESVERYSAEVSKSRDMFLAVLGHDLRGPLTAIRMGADLLSKSEVADSARVRVAARIGRACSAITYLSSDLLDYTRLRLGDGIPVEQSDCDLAQVCVEAVDEMRGSYPGREFIERASGDLRVQCDARRMKQVLWNLLDNAVHHGDRARPIALETEGRADSAVIRVSSFGEPIPAESLPGIFEPMHRISGTGPDATGHPLSGVGLGLYIVREIVRSHGGSVTVASDLENGTVFTVALPRHARSADLA